MQTLTALWHVNYSYNLWIRFIIKVIIPAPTAAGQREGEGLETRLLLLQIAVISTDIQLGGYGKGSLNWQVLFIIQCSICNVLHRYLDRHKPWWDRGTCTWSNISSVTTSTIILILSISDQQVTGLCLSTVVETAFIPRSGHYIIVSRPPPACQIDYRLKFFLSERTMKNFNFT